MAAAPIDVSGLSEEEIDDLLTLMEEEEALATASDEEKQRMHECARLQADFAAFVKAAWHVVQPGVVLDWSWHYDLIGEYLTLVHARKIRRLIINISPRTLKALSLDTPIPTPDGMIPLREVHPGMLVYGVDGKPTRVIAESPVYRDSECYEVEFATGEKIVADAGHLWETTARTVRPGVGKIGAPKERIKGKYGTLGYKQQGYRSPSLYGVRTTREIAETLRVGKRNNHAVRVAAPIQNEPKFFPIDPYVLGAWLGDGTSRTAQITIGAEDAEAMTRNIAEAGEQIHFVGFKTGTENGTYRLGPIEFKWKRGPETFTSRLEILGVRSNKHIPEQYFLGSESQRMALLQGLMDTDGSAAKNGELRFAGCSERVVRDVHRLIRSLGIKATINDWPARIKGRIVGHVWSVSFWEFRDRPVFRLERKSARQKVRGLKTLQNSRYIVAVRPVPSVPVKCLMVDNPDRMFLVGEGYIPTHNSILVSVMFPVWVWTKQPGHGFACASYAANLSTEHSVMRRSLIESDWFRARWGDRIWLAKDQNEKTKFKNNHQAQMIATSVGGSATGLGGNTLILDDGMDPKRAASDADILTTHKWFDETWRSRLNNPAEDALIVMEQRTSERDVTGHLLEADKELERKGDPREWVHLAIPLECDEETGAERWVFPISGRIRERQVGEVLQPKRFPPEVISAWKIRRLVWATQYQQRPSPLEGNMIKRSDVQYYGGRDPKTGVLDEELPAKFDFVLTSADCAFKDEATSDYVCVGTIGIKGPDRFILEVVNKHLDEPATRTEILRQRNKWGATVVLVEDKANGSAVIKDLRRKVPGLIAINPEGGKFARMYASCGEWQAGNWYVSRTEAWAEPFVDQITKFPSAAHDDMCDMMTQACTHLQRQSYVLGLVDYMKSQDVMKKTKREQTKTKPANQEAPVVDTTIQVPGETAKVDTSHISKQDVDDSTPRCGSCGSTLIQKMPSGQRCGSCGAQWGMAKPQMTKPSFGAFDGLRK